LRPDATKLAWNRDFMAIRPAFNKQKLPPSDASRHFIFWKARLGVFGRD
jgi:hypothetical protein